VGKNGEHTCRKERVAVREESQKSEKRKEKGLNGTKDT
jgi:hypothetical protein